MNLSNAFVLSGEGQGSQRMRHTCTQNLDAAQSATAAAGARLLGRQWWAEAGGLHCGRAARRAARHGRLEAFGCRGWLGGHRRLFLGRRGILVAVVALLRVLLALRGKKKKEGSRGAVGQTKMCGCPANIYCFESCSKKKHRRAHQN